MKRVSIALLMVTALAACGRGGGEQADTNAVAASGFVPPVMQAPAPVAGQRNVTPLTAYVGHHPRDAVDGVSFYDRTEVANALIDAVADEKLRHEIVSRDVTQVPIFQQGEFVAAHGCSPHDCAGRNWTVLIAPDGNVEKASVCFHDTATTGDASRWTTRQETTRRPGDCPQA